MAEIFTASIAEIVDRLNLEMIYTPKKTNELYVSENDCNRPGL